MAACLRPGGWLVDEDADWGTATPVDPAHPPYDDYQRVWRDGDWWVPRGYDKAFGQKLPALFERCGSRTYAMRRPPRWCGRLALGEMAHPDPGGHQRARR